MITATPQDVIREARRLFETGPGAGTLRIADDFVMEGEWLHLIATPDRPGGSALDYVDEVERVETELRRKFGDEILIVPAKP